MAAEKVSEEAQMHKRWGKKPIPNQPNNLST